MNIPAGPRGRHCSLHLSLSLLFFSTVWLQRLSCNIHVRWCWCRDKAGNMPSARHITHLLLFYVLITFSAAADGRQMRPWWRFRSWEVTGVACVPRWRGLDICSPRNLDLLPNVIVVCTKQGRKENVTVQAKSIKGLPSKLKLVSFTWTKAVSAKHKLITPQHVQTRYKYVL